MPSKVVFELKSHEAIYRIKLLVATDSNETSLARLGLQTNLSLQLCRMMLDNPRALYDTAVVLPTTRMIFERLATGFSGMPFEFERLAILYVALIHDPSPRASLSQSLTHGTVA